MRLTLYNAIIIYSNPATSETLQKSKSELINKTFAESFFEYSENDDFNQIILEVIYDSTTKHERIVQYFTGTEIKHLHIRTSSLKSIRRFNIEKLCRTIAKAF